MIISDPYLHTGMQGKVNDRYNILEINSLFCILWFKKKNDFKLEILLLEGGKFCREKGYYKLMKPELYFTSLVNNGWKSNLFFINLSPCSCLFIPVIF